MSALLAIPVTWNHLGGYATPMSLILSPCASDFNAKLGAEIIRGEIHQMSNNGACLNGIIEKYDLAVLNALEICSGIFTWVKNKIPVERSVLDCHYFTRSCFICEFIEN